MDRNNGFCPIAHLLFYFDGIDVEVRQFDIDKDRFCSDVPNHVCCCRMSKGGENDLIAPLYSEREEGDVQGRGCRGCCDGMLAPLKALEQPLELPHLGPLDDPSVSQGFQDGFFFFFAEKWSGDWDLHSNPMGGDQGLGIGFFFRSSPVIVSPFNKLCESFPQIHLSLKAQIPLCPVCAPDSMGYKSLSSRFVLYLEI